MTQDAAPEVGRPAVVIQHLLPPGIPHQGIDGEVPPGGGLGRPQVRRELHREPPMSDPGLRIAAREGKIPDLPGAVGELDHPERPADQVCPAPLLPATPPSAYMPTNWNPLITGDVYFTALSVRDDVS